MCVCVCSLYTVIHSYIDLYHSQVERFNAEVQVTEARCFYGYQIAIEYVKHIKLDGCVMLSLVVQCKLRMYTMLIYSRACVF